ncbi:MAG: hypothetical protein Q9212_004798 [Teloschistes hypoglaucus]
MQNIKNAASYVGDKVQGPQPSFPFVLGTIADLLSYLAIAKDGNVPIGTRMRAAGDMAEAKAHKEKSKH